MSISNTSIVNMALGGVGAKRINDIDDTTDTKPEAIQARLHFETTRDALIESYWWRFASARATLSVSDVSPTGDEWDYKFALPNDFLAMRSVYEDRFSHENLRSYALEGKWLLTNEDEMEIRYIKKVTDPTEFDPLFVKLLVAYLKDIFVVSLAGSDKHLSGKIERELAKLEKKAAARSAQEVNTEGTYSLETWNDARYD